jgi:hypothetical protein
MVVEHVAAGRLKKLQIANQEDVALPLYVVHERGRTPGRAGRWLIADLRKRLTNCPQQNMYAAVPVESASRAGACDDFIASASSRRVTRAEASATRP